MKQLLSFCLALMLGLTLPFAALAYAPDLQSPSDTVLGDARFDAYIPLLEGKRVALFSNHSGIVGDMTSGTGDAAGMDPSLIPFGRDSGGNEIEYGEHVLDAMLAHGVNVTAIFSPEHGFRGTASAGEAVSDSVDPATGVPILSLISMYYLMDACAAAGKPVVLLDRPNPNGFYVDGPILQEEFKSGVGRLPVPIVHGLTLGELARMINGEGWLEAGKDACDLTVIPCLNYTHGDRVPLVRAPSPNLKDMRAVYLYASTCFFENTVVSVGRGTDHPFEIFGSPYLAGDDAFDYSFTPVSMPGANEPPFEGRVCQGRQLMDTPLEDIWSAGINLDYLVDAYNAVLEDAPGVDFFGTPDSQGRYWLDKLCGTDEVRKMIVAGESAAAIKASWQGDVEAFREQRKPYLLYAE